MSLDPETEHKILQCIDEVLETLGRSGKHAFNSFLERNLGLKKKDIPRKPELFSKGLNMVFGKQGADALETAMVQKLLTNLGIDPKSKLTLVGVIKAAQHKPC
jgi:hypothetical protein